MWTNRLWRSASLLLALVTALVAGVGGLALAQGGGNGLPDLPPGQHVGVIYSNTAPEAAEAIGAAFAESLAAGVDAYELAVSWGDLEAAPGVFNAASLTDPLDILASVGVLPYISLQTINTVNLTLPADLMGASASELAAGLSFDDPALLDRFGALLDTIVPPLAERGGFFISVGNEIDPWLADHPDQVEPFLAFVAASRARVQTLAPGMGVGATVTFDAVAEGVPWLPDLLAISDAAVFTYYPLAADYTARDPAVVAEDVARMVAAAGDLPVLLQEVGYPSGYLPDPSNGSSVEQQRQFVVNMFDAVAAHPPIRFVSFLQLADWGDAVCDYFMTYYGVSEPRFGEYLCSLGLHEYDGTPKPAFDAFLEGVRRLRG